MYYCSTAQHIGAHRCDLQHYSRSAAICRSLQRLPVIGLPTIALGAVPIATGPDWQTVHALPVRRFIKFYYSFKNHGRRIGRIEQLTRAAACAAVSK
jgi:hypothetical protein